MDLTNIGRILKFCKGKKENYEKEWLFRKRGRRRRSSWTYKIWYGLKICKKEWKMKGRSGC